MSSVFADTEGDSLKFTVNTCKQWTSFDVSEYSNKYQRILFSSNIRIWFTNIWQSFIWITRCLSLWFVREKAISVEYEEATNFVSIEIKINQKFKLLQKFKYIDRRSLDTNYFHCKILFSFKKIYIFRGYLFLFFIKKKKKKNWTME